MRELKKSAKAKPAAVTARKARLGENPPALGGSEVLSDGRSESIWQSGQGELAWKRWVTLKCNSGEPCCAPQESGSATPPDFRAVCSEGTDKMLKGC